MRKDEVDKEYQVEHSHWWYVGIREICFDLMQRWVFNHFKKEKCSILDIGCGTGGNLEHFNRYGSTTGIDLDAYSVEYCRKKNLNVHVGTMADLKYPKKSFNVVSFFDVLDQIPLESQSGVLEQVYDILKPGGYIVLREPGVKCFGGRHDSEVNIHIRYNQKIMRSLLENAGFSITTMTYCNFFLSIPIFIKRKIDMVFNQSPRSDVVESGSLSNTFFLSVLRFEKILLRFLKFPFGVSLFIIAQKPVQ